MKEQGIEGLKMRSNNTENKLSQDKDWYQHSDMEKFLDSLSNEVDTEPSKLIPYTKEMDAELDDLLSGVESE